MKINRKIWTLTSLFILLTLFIAPHALARKPAVLPEVELSKEKEGYNPINADGSIKEGAPLAPAKMNQPPKTELPWIIGAFFVAVLPLLLWLAISRMRATGAKAMDDNVIPLKTDKNALDKTKKAA